MSNLWYFICGNSERVWVKFLVVWPVPDTVLWLSNLAYFVLKLKWKVMHLAWNGSPLDTGTQKRRKSRVSWIFKSLCLEEISIYLITQKFCVLHLQSNISILHLVQWKYNYMFQPYRWAIFRL